MSVNSAGLLAGDYTGTVTVTAAGAAGSPKTIAVSLHLDPPDTTPPSAPTGLIATFGPSGIGLGWNASTDTVGVTNYNLHRSTTPGFTPTTANRIAQPTGTSYTDPGLAPGTYYYRVTAQDAANNISTNSNEANATVPNTAPPRPGSSLRTPSTPAPARPLADLSGTGNNGTITGATWSTQGHAGGALSFDGVNDLVSIADANSLDLTIGMTLEAWVRPAVVTNLADGRAQGAAGSAPLRALCEQHRESPVGQHLHRRRP